MAWLHPLWLSLCLQTRVFFSACLARRPDFRTCPIFDFYSIFSLHSTRLYHAVLFPTTPTFVLLSRPYAYPPLFPHVAPRHRTAYTQEWALYVPQLHDVGTILTVPIYSYVDCALVVEH